jgi:hypothetical protein
LPFALVLLALTLVVSGCGLFKKTATVTGTSTWMSIGRGRHSKKTQQEQVDRQTKVA